MTVRRMVDARPLCPDELALFASAHEAWAHLSKHVLDPSEAWCWSLLIPTLRVLLDAGRRADLLKECRQASPDEVSGDLSAVWRRFLELVATAVEQGAKLGWYWEEAPTPREGPYRAFGSSGILAYLDDEVVRTGFLPFRGEVPIHHDGRAHRYRLFARCWEKVQFKYQKALQAGRVRDAPGTFQALMRKPPDPGAWEQLA